MYKRSQCTAYNGSNQKIVPTIQTDYPPSNETSSEMQSQIRTKTNKSHAALLPEIGFTAGTGKQKAALQTSGRTSSVPPARRTEVVPEYFSLSKLHE